MAITNYVELAAALRSAPLTLADIEAIDTTSGLCARPFIATQVLRAQGYEVTVTSDANGIALFQVTA